jgi:hypothetical protein
MVYCSAIFIDIFINDINTAIVITPINLVIGFLILKADNLTGLFKPTEISYKGQLVSVT